MYIITGASRGIGRYLFEELSKKGEKVYGTYNSTFEKPSCNLSKIDISDSESVRSWIEGLAVRGQEVNLVNCAGINYSALAHKADLDNWARVINVNLIGTFNVIHALLPHMQESEYGRIINISSVVAQRPIAGTSAYAASKSALWGMSRSIAAENAKLGVTINNINLGYFDIGMIDEVPEKVQVSVKKGIPCGEFGTPSDILKTVEYIVETKYLNGTSIDLSAGLI